MTKVFVEQPLALPGSANKYNNIRMFHKNGDFSLKFEYILNLFVRIIYMSANFSNWDLHRIILGKTIVLHNRCINLCPEKFYLGQRQIASQAMFFEQLNCLTDVPAPGSWEVEFKPQLIQAYFGKKYRYIFFHQFVTICLRDLQQA